MIASPLQIENGHAVLEDRPGSGIEWNEDAVERFALS